MHVLGGSQLITISKTLWLAAILAALSISAEALAFQTHGSVGNVNGRVTDPKGAPVPQVKVLLINKGTGGKRSAKTDKSGYYEFIWVPLAEYTVKVEAPGYDVAQSDIRLIGGQDVVANLKLQIPKVKVIQTLPDDKPAAPANPQ